MLVLLERLSPNERAVYVLREAFDYPHREIADILDLTEAASQQILHRAKKHLAQGRARTRTEIDAAAARRIIDEFLAAAKSGRTEPLVRLLTQDAVAIGDGGGKVPARARAFEGALAVATFMRGLFKPGKAKRDLEVTGTGRIVVDRTMRSVSHPDVYAIGDAASARGPADKPLRMSCASGVPTAWQAADAIAARLTGGKVPTVPVRYFNQCISLGRGDGLIQYVTADDRAVPAALTGRLAALYKEIICKGAAWGVAHPTLLPVRRRRVVREAVAPEGAPVGTAA
ncbi:sigma factor-like helix-turn-helix DNA-binding protein [Streptomyces sp. NPDC003007]